MSDNRYIAGVTEKYPEQILKGRITIEGNVIACIYADPLLIDETDLKVKDFLTADGAFYFSLAKELRGRGYSVFDEVTILSSINDTVEAAFTDRGGYETIQNLTDVVNTKNYEVYLDQFYRENIIVSLYDNGFNLLKAVDDNGKEVVPLNLFRKMDSESVLDWYESKLGAAGTGYTNKVLEEGFISFDDNFFEQMDNGEECGVPIAFAGDDINLEEMRCLPFLSNQLGGFFDGTFNVLAGHSSVGKSSLWVTMIMAMVNYGRKVVIISNEQKMKVFKINFLVWYMYKYYRYYSATRKKFRDATLSDKDKEMRAKAMKSWNENYGDKIKFISIADADMKLVKKKIRENVLQYGFDTVVYDTMKIDGDDLANTQIWASIIKDSRDFDKIAKKYNIIMLCSLQLSMNTKGKLFLDGSELSMSKQAIEVMESLLELRSVYTEEIDKTNKKYYCNPFRVVKVDDKWVEEEYIADPKSVYKMLFLCKGRNGSNSIDTGVAYLLEYDGNHGIFKEVAQCRPRHGTIGN